MFRRFTLGFGIVLLSVVSVWADNPLEASLSPGTAAVVRLSLGGVDDGVVVAYIHAQSTRIAPTAADFEALKTAGVSPGVLSQVARHDALFTPAGRVPVTESDMFRLFGSELYHRGRVYGIGGGLPSTVKEELLTDPKVRDDILGSAALKTDANWLSWGGLGLTVAGAIFSVAAESQDPITPSWGPAVGLGAVGGGVVSMLIGSIVDAVAYRDLYHGLYQYNQDQLHPSPGAPS